MAERSTVVRTMRLSRETAQALEDLAEKAGESPNRLIVRWIHAEARKKLGRVLAEPRPQGWPKGRKRKPPADS